MESLFIRFTGGFYLLSLICAVFKHNKTTAKTMSKRKPKTSGISNLTWFFKKKNNNNV